MPSDPSPRYVTFEDLFDNVGTDDLRYSQRAADISGTAIAIEGFLAHAHTHEIPEEMLLVDQPGLCADCSPVPAAVISLPGAIFDAGPAGGSPVRVVGRLDFGFKIEHGVASFIRIEDAAISPVETT